MADIIQLRRGTTVEWETANTVLAEGEMGLDVDLDKIKIGDGTSTWLELDSFYSRTHEDLAGRNSADQHTIDSISLLVDTLNNKLNIDSEIDGGIWL